MGLFQILKEMADKVQRKNKLNPNVKTADTSVFDNIKNAIDQVKERNGGGEPEPRKHVETVESLKERVFEVKRQNEADPNVETADDSVFAELNEMLEKYKAESNVPSSSNEVIGEEVNYEEVVPTPSTPAPTAEDDRVVALTNSMGGSLALRAEPDLGAAVNSIRVPDMSRVFVMSYSDHHIILDGKKSRWVYVDFNGQHGWILESYLNFN